MAVDQNKKPQINGSVILMQMTYKATLTLVDRFMGMVGAAVGLSIGALPIHARFSQPHDKVAAVSAFIIFVSTCYLTFYMGSHRLEQARTFGGTVGLAQCGAVMNAKVAAYIVLAAKSGQITLSDAAHLTSIGTTSVQNISSLPEGIQTVFREAFRSGTRWCFISLIPWCGVSFIGTLFLKKIVDTDNLPNGGNVAMAPLTEKRQKSVGGQAMAESRV